MEKIYRLTELFRRFPGIGPRQAKRFVYFLLGENRAYLEELARIILSLGNEIKTCTECARFFPARKADDSVCLTCLAPERDRSMLMIVAKDVDYETMEKSHTYTGTYFILGGTVPILEKEPDARVRGAELLRHIEKRMKGTSPLREIILAMNMTTEGEHTADHIRRLILPFVQTSGITVSVLGRGLSSGAELEYADSETLTSAFKNRQ